MLADQFVASWEELVNFDRLRKYRLSRVTKALKDAGLDALISFKADNVRYISSIRPITWEAGYQTRNMVIVDVKGNVSLFVASGDYQRVKENDTWLQNVKPLASMEDAGISQRVISELLLPELSRMGLRCGTIGLDATTFYTIDFIKRALTERKSKLVDGNVAMNNARAVKSVDEIRLIRVASAIVDAGISEASSNLIPGRKENEIAGKGLEAMYGLGSEWMPMNPVVFSGGGHFRRFSTDKAIRYGENVVVSLSAMNDGYCGEASRTFSIAGGSASWRDRRNSVGDLYSKMLPKCIPGSNTQELVSTYTNTLREMGFGQPHGYLIRGVGLSLIDLPLVGIDPNSQNARLEENMVINLQLRATKSGEETIQLSDTIHVGGSGPSLLTRFQEEA